MSFSGARPHGRGVLTDCPTEPPRACTSGGRSSGKRESVVSRVDRQNLAREQSCYASQLIASCLTRTRAEKCRMSAEIAGLLLICRQFFCVLAWDGYLSA